MRLKLSVDLKPNWKEHRMKKIKIQLCTLLMAIFSLSACESCSTEREEPMENESDKNEQESTIENWIESLNLNIKEQNNDMDYSKFPLDDGKNGQAPTVRLNSGYDMPIVGLGTYSLTGDICVNSVKAAIKAGFRKIDTAHMYGNKVEVGRGVRESGVPREEIFVATTIYPNQYDDPEASIEECLRKLDLGYVDLMLLHHPGTNDVKAYKAMEKFVKKGFGSSASYPISWYGSRSVASPRRSWPPERVAQ